MRHDPPVFGVVIVEKVGSGSAVFSWDQGSGCNNKNMLFGLSQGSLKLYCYFEISFHTVFHGISLVFGFMNGQLASHAINSRPTKWMRSLIKLKI